MGGKERIDVIRHWSETKLKIVAEYAKPFSTIFSANKRKGWARHIYIDAFAGQGISLSADTGSVVLGSALKVLDVEPPFKEYHFVEKNPSRFGDLKAALETYAPETRGEVFTYLGDCNYILPERIFPIVGSSTTTYALCFLDPKGLDYQWQTVVGASKARRIDLFLLFMIYGANRNWFLRDMGKLDKYPGKVKKFDEFWGDHSWFDIATSGMLIRSIAKKTVSSEGIAQEYRNRLESIAGFNYVPEPLPFVNNGKLLYYLFFASHNETAGRIMGQIFDKYRKNRT
jgi:three-Cys-motif partner protein